MKILWLLTTTDFPHINGGNLKHVLSWWRTIKSMSLPIECCLVLSAKNEDNLISLVKEYQSYGLKTYGISSLKTFYKSYFGRGKEDYCRILEKESPDIVHSLLIQSDLIALKYKRQFNYKVVSSLEGKLFPQKPIIKYLLYYIFNKYYRRYVDSNIAISHYTLVENARLGYIQRKRTKIIYSGVNINEFSHNIQPKSGNIVTIGFLGNISNGKLPFLFVDVANEILKRHSENVRFVIGGEGIDLERLRSYVTSLGLDDYIKFEGFVKNVPQFFSNIDVLLFTSLREGLPWTILEAMASKTCVISSSVGGIPEVIINGENGILFEDNNVKTIVPLLESLITQPILRCKLITNAYQCILTKYTSEVEVGNFLKLYTSLLNK